jgi:hypothetical protein
MLAALPSARPSTREAGDPAAPRGGDFRDNGTRCAVAWSCSVLRNRGSSLTKILAQKSLKLSRPPLKPTSRCVGMSAAFKTWDGTVRLSAR